MSIGVSPAPPVAHAGPAAAVEVDVHGRWDALALYELLAPFNSFLVQHTTDRWVVHASAPECRGESLAEALHAIDEWCAERRIDTSGPRLFRQLAHHAACPVVIVHPLAEITGAHGAGREVRS